MNLDLSDRQISQGRRLLRQLLPDLRRGITLANTEDGLQPTSILGLSMMVRIRFENLDALVIRRSATGWHADVVLTGLPTGVSNVMGTPESHPLPDQEEALKAGTEILRQLCRQAMENAAAVRDMPQKDLRPFELHGHTFQIPGLVVDQIAQVWSVVGPALMPDRETARVQLTQTLIQLMGSDRLDPDLYEALPDVDKSRIGIGMATLLLFGEFRHPDRPMAQPAEEDPSP